jgi:hypothetical protein
MEDFRRMKQACMSARVAHVPLRALAGILRPVALDKCTSRAPIGYQANVISTTSRSRFTVRR